MFRRNILPPVGHLIIYTHFSINCYPRFPMRLKPKIYEVSCVRKPVKIKIFLFEIGELRAFKKEERGEVVVSALFSVFTIPHASARVLFGGVRQADRQADLRFFSRVSRRSTSSPWNFIGPWMKGAEQIPVIRKVINRVINEPHRDTLSLSEAAILRSNIVCYPLARQYYFDALKIFLSFDKKGEKKICRFEGEGEKFFGIVPKGIVNLIVISFAGSKIIRSSSISIEETREERNYRSFLESFRRLNNNKGIEETR